MSGSVVIDIATPMRQWADILPNAEDLVRGAAAAAWTASGGDTSAVVEISVVMADDATVRALNREHRGKDKPTNVLSFPIGAEGSPESGSGDGREAAPVMLGDVVLACETVTAEAAAQGKSVADHLRHLVVHGVLHLSGHDHEDDAAAERMERLETRILADLGVNDPYEYGDVAE